MPTPPEIVDRIAGAARANSGRSKLFRWMRANRDVFAQMLEDERPNWAALAAAFANEGFTAPDGKPLRPESVRHTWYRARKSAERKKGDAKPQQPAPVAIKIEHSRSDSLSPQAGEKVDPLEDIRRQARLRSGRAE